ncbi:hypothetical protein LJC56_10420 [Christensenellaceae bacterium OttesenSCG-928-K19]|nr:hypothetical protein [Christensenellaceae bacterium OttesenSCG-928-K19]
MKRLITVAITLLLILSFTLSASAFAYTDQENSINIDLDLPEGASYFTAEGTKNINTDAESDLKTDGDVRVYVATYLESEEDAQQTAYSLEIIAIPRDSENTQPEEDGDETAPTEGTEDSSGDGDADRSSSDETAAEESTTPGEDVDGEDSTSEEDTASEAEQTVESVNPDKINEAEQEDLLGVATALLEDKYELDEEPTLAPLGNISDTLFLSGTGITDSDYSAYNCEVYFTMNEQNYLMTVAEYMISAENENYIALHTQLDDIAFGKPEPVATPTPTPTVSATPEPTPTPTVVATATPTPEPTPAAGVFDNIGAFFSNIGKIITHAYQNDPNFFFYVVGIIVVVAIVILLILLLRNKRKEREAQSRVEENEYYDDRYDDRYQNDRYDRPGRYYDDRYDNRDRYQENQYQSRYQDNRYDRYQEDRYDNQPMQEPARDISQRTAYGIDMGTPGARYDQDYAEDISRYTQHPGRHVNDVSRYTHEEGGLRGDTDYSRNSYIPGMDNRRDEYPPTRQQPDYGATDYSRNSYTPGMDNRRDEYPPTRQQPDYGATDYSRNSYTPGMDNRRDEYPPTRQQPNYGMPDYPRNSYSPATDNHTEVYPPTGERPQAGYGAPPPQARRYEKTVGSRAERNRKRKR